MSNSFLTVSEAAAYCGARCTAQIDVPLTGVFHDTRTPCPGGLYIALGGRVHDGHDHVAAAVQAGAVAVLVEHPVDLPTTIAQLEVADTRVALHALACGWRGVLSNLQVIGITGTAGKTTTKDLLHAMARAGKGGFASPRSFNNDIGVPLTVLGARPEDHMLIAEVGTSGPGEIAPLAQLLQPHVSIITCIGQGHLEGLGSVDAVRREKYALAASTSELVLLAHQGLPTPLTDARVETFGVHPDADHVVSSRYTVGSKMHVDVSGKAWPSPLPGRHGAMNVAAAVCAAQAVGCCDNAIRQGIEQASITPGRFSVLDTCSMTLVDDTWNSNPASAAAALEALGDLSKGRSVAIVLGAMLELGVESVDAHRQLGKVVSEFASRMSLKSLVLVGDAFAHVREAYPPHAFFAGELGDDAVQEVASSIAGKGRVVLVKGSRSFQLERVIEALCAESKVLELRRTMSE